MKLLNKRFPNEKFPPVIVHLFYFMSSLTFCYIYYHKFAPVADFYGKLSSNGIYAVLKGEAVKPLQFRILIPLIFKALASVIGLVKHISDKAIFFIIIVIICYLILLSFYFLLNEHFKNKNINCWLAFVIFYPMMWNFIIMNGQFFYMDYSVLLIIILGFYFIVSEKYNWLLVVFAFGLLNHPSVGYLIPAFLLYNYKKLLAKKTIIYTIVMTVLYIGVYKFMDYIYPSEEGYFILYNLPRNLSLFTGILPAHILIRDAILNLGGIHLFLLLFLISGQWKKFRSPLLYANLVIFPYILSVLINFSIEEVRNYITIIPFVLILFLLYLSTFENSFLVPADKFLSNTEKK